MRYRILTTAIVLGAVALPAPAGATTALDGHPSTCDGQPVTAHLHRARVLLKQAYDTTRPVEKPDREAIDKAQAHRRCINLVAPRKTISELRDKLKLAHKEALLRQQVTPFPGPGNSWWAIPAYIVACESGYDYTPDFGLTFGGAYGILVSTWHSYGGGRYASQANYAKPVHQDLIASRIWHDVGPSAWACA